MTTDARMTDAQRRFTLAPQSIAAAIHTIHTDHEFARVSHPLGAAALNAELTKLLRDIGEMPIGPERLLAAEAGAAHMAARRAESDAEARRRKEAQTAAAHAARMEPYFAARRADQSAKLTAPIRNAITVMRTKIDRAADRLVSVSSDAELLEALADVEMGIRPLGIVVGAERRAAKLRLAADCAKVAADAVTAVAA